MCDRPYNFPPPPPRAPLLLARFPHPFFDLRKRLIHPFSCILAPRCRLYPAGPPHNQSWRQSKPRRTWPSCTSETITEALSRLSSEPEPPEGSTTDRQRRGRFGDVHYYYSSPAQNPPHHRFDKGSYVYLFENANERRARVEVANNAGSDDQDAFEGCKRPLAPSPPSPQSGNHQTHNPREPGKPPNFTNHPTPHTQT